MPIWKTDEGRLQSFEQGEAKLSGLKCAALAPLASFSFPGGVELSAAAGTAGA
jgi:hypothetical protein